MGNFKMQIMGFILSIPALVIALSFHEFAHGFAAYKMGDNTAKYQGRLSLNPFHHLDPIGTLCLFLFHFGWAKPVPINPYNFRNRRLGIIVVSLAGPMMNFLIALISAILLEFVSPFAVESQLGEFLWSVLYYCVLLNVGLMCFNLIPIPPLDGSKVLLEFLPFRYRELFYQAERYATFILMALLWTNALNPVLGTMRTFVMTVISTITGLIF